MKSQAVLRRGQPVALRMDKGSPFGSTGPAGRARLSAWRISRSIEVPCIRPGHPQDNVSHEQWPRELKADTTGLRPAGHRRGGSGSHKV
jgi:transposase InsO family protein